MNETEKELKELYLKYDRVCLERNKLKEKIKNSEFISRSNNKSDAFLALLGYIFKDYPFAIDVLCNVDGVDVKYLMETFDNKFTNKEKLLNELLDKFEERFCILKEEDVTIYDSIVSYLKYSLGN